MPDNHMPVWEQRFRAPAIGFPRWARDAPDHLVVGTNESGIWQIYAWDRITGSRRQVTDHPIGVPAGACTPDGERVVWFDDATGDEVGHWMAEPFDGSGPPQPLIPGLDDAWSAGLAMEEDVVVAGTAGDDGYAVHLFDGGNLRRIHHHPEILQVGGLSRDSALLCLEHAEHGDSIHLDLRVIDPRTGDVVGEQHDGPGLGLSAAGWSPVQGDQRLAIVHEREGKDRPAIWDLTTGERHDLKVGLAGEISVAGWWPDASALLLVHEHEGRDQLFQLRLADEALTAIDHPTGTISSAGVRPDGDVWYRVSSGSMPSSVRGPGGDEVCSTSGRRAPGGQPYRSMWFTNPGNNPIHMFVATPPGEGPHPVVMLVHGGPTAADADEFSAAVQAWVDHGVAVAMVNYRGSTGYGVQFRDALIGNPGFPEVEDVVAGLEALVAAGVVDQRRAAVAGGSWGGYITLLAIGLHPERWTAAVGAVPVADYVTAYRDEAPNLQSFDRTLFGGSPDEVGHLYEERSPLTYVDRVRTPLLVIAGDNDSRCPIRQVLNYVDALRERGGKVELYRFDAGHGSMVIDERVRQMAAELAFVLPRLAFSTQSD